MVTDLSWPRVAARAGALKPRGRARASGNRYRTRHETAEETSSGSCAAGLSGRSVGNLRDVASLRGAGWRMPSGNRQPLPSFFCQPTVCAALTITSVTPLGSASIER